MRLALKIVIVAGLSLAILLPLLMIRGVIHDRQRFRQEAVERIAQSEAGHQAVAPPVLVVPYTETVAVAYDPAATRPELLLKAFWENHDPTQGMRQGNDVGTQYRSAVYYSTPEQEAAARAAR